MPNKTIVHQSTSLSKASKTDLETEQQRILLKKLRKEALARPVVNPPEEIWERIKSTRGSSHLHYVNNKPKYFIQIAASVFFISLIFLVMNNYKLQNELTDALVANSVLEGQLMRTSTLTFNQTKMLSRVRLIEVELQQAQTTREKLLLLKKREIEMKAMVRQTQGKKYEYSI